MKIQIPTITCTECNKLVPATSMLIARLETSVASRYPDHGFIFRDNQEKLWRVLDFSPPDGWAKGKCPDCVSVIKQEEPQKEVQIGQVIKKASPPPTGHVPIAIKSMSMTACPSPTVPSPAPLPLKATPIATAIASQQIAIGGYAVHKGIVVMAPLRTVSEPLRPNMIRQQAPVIQEAKLTNTVIAEDVTLTKPATVGVIVKYTDAPMSSAFGLSVADSALPKK